MRKLLIALTALAAAAILAAAPAAGQGPIVVNGGGTGSFFGDVDGDGDIEASQFGLGATILGGGAARGHFECLMAGRSDIFGLPLMAVGGRVTGGSTLGAGSVQLSGTGTVNLGNGTIFRGVGFQVVLVDGGPGSGSLQLTVFGAFDGIPGDTVPGNGNYDLPAESITSGQISIH